MTVSLSRQFVDPAIASEPKEDWKPLENLVTLYCYDYQFHWPFPDESGQEGQRHNDEPGGDQIQAESKFCTQLSVIIMAREREGVSKEFLLLH